MLAVTFLFPMILAAAGAAAAPVIIHLILRTKPRRILFPAMRFVRRSHQASLSKLRLKHLILLAMRILAIVLLALLIARPQWPQWEAVAETDVPTAAVVVVDNSGSMGYVHRGQTVLARGKERARQVIDSLPAGSRVAILPTHLASTKAALLSDRKLLAEQLAAVEATHGSRTLGSTIQRALTLLEETDLPRKEVYIVSDMTERSWREVRIVGGKDVAFIVLNCAGGEDANISLGQVRLDRSSAPQGAEVTVETLIRSTQVAGELDVRVTLDGRVVESRPVDLRGGAAAGVALTFSPTRVGLAHGTVEFDQADPLAMDNVRYFTLQVGPPAEALIARDPATIGRGDPTSFLMGHAVAPPASDGAAAWLRRRIIPADRMDAAALAAVRMVILADVASLSGKQWGELEQFVRGGGHVWVVIGSLVSPASYNSPEAQRLLPAAVGDMEVLADRIGWRRPKPGEPMLQPFAADANPPLSQVRCERRFRLASTAADAHVPLRYADDAPAILTRKVGEGSTVLWNFSPTREFSNLAGLQQFPILAQRTARLLAGRATDRMAYTWGQLASVGVPRSMAGAVVTLRKPDSRAELPLVYSPAQQALTIPADRLGHWTVRFAAGGAAEQRGFSVNADFTESDLTAVAAEELHKVFPPDSLVIASDLSELTRRRRKVSRPLDLAVPLLLVLLVLLIGESFFANRFYRREESPPSP